MPEWLETGINFFVGALTFALLVKYRDRGILKRIGACHDAGYRPGHPASRHISDSRLDAQSAGLVMNLAAHHNAGAVLSARLSRNVNS